MTKTPIIASLLLCCCIACATRQSTTMVVPRAPLALTGLAEVHRLFLRGRYLSLNNQHQQAAQAFINVLQIKPQHFPARYALVQEQLQLGQVDQARSALQPLLEIEPKSADAYFLLGKVELLSNHKDEALAAFATVLQIEPQHEEAASAMINVLVYTKDYSAAQTLLQTRLAKSPQDAQSLYFMGRIYTEQGELDSAKLYFKKVPHASMHYLSALQALSRIAEYEKEYPLAVNYLQQINDLEPNNAATLARLSQLLIETDQYAAAVQILQQLQGLTPDDASLPIRIGLVYVKLHQDEVALAWLRLAVKLDPTAERAHFYLASLAQQLKHPEEAIKHFMLVRDDTEVYVDAVLSCSHLLEQEKRSDAAEKLLRQAVKKRSDAMDLAIALAAHYEKHSKLKQAEALFVSYQQRYPNDEKLLFYYATFKHRQGDVAGSLSMMNRLVEMNPDHATALNFIGYTYAEQNQRLDEAEMLVRRASEIKPGDGYITDSLGWVLYQQQRYQEALPILEEADRLAPKESIILEHLGDVRRQVKQQQKALDAYRKALEYADSPATSERLQKKVQELQKQLSTSAYPLSNRLSWQIS